MSEYQRLLTEIELWLQTVRQSLTVDYKKYNQTELQQDIEKLTRYGQELADKEDKLGELKKACEEFRNHPDLEPLAGALLEQLNLLTAIFAEHKTLLLSRVHILNVHLLEVKQKRQQSPDLSESTLDSSSMPVEEIPVLADAKQPESDLVTRGGAGVSIETQTGRSLASPLGSVTRDVSVTCKPPTDAQVQAQLSQNSSEGDVVVPKETLTILKTVSGGKETIRIATKPLVDAQPLVEEPDDLLVKADYRKPPQRSESKTSELSISNYKANQPFETVFVEPDETTTEVIVDADGTKRIIVKKLHRTLVSRQQTVQQQQQLTTVNTLADGKVPASQSFSQVTLHGQQSSTTVARGDGTREVLTTQNYGGRVISGVPGAEVDVREFRSEPQEEYTIVQETKPSEVDIQGVKLHEGDVTFVDPSQNFLIPADSSGAGHDVRTSSSSVRAVVQQVTRRIVRKTRRIIRRVVIVNGKEEVTEEVVEEPEEIEVTEEGLPRVTINVTRTEDGKIVKQEEYGEGSERPPMEEEKVSHESAEGKLEESRASEKSEEVKIEGSKSTEENKAEEEKIEATEHETKELEEIVKESEAFETKDEDKIAEGTSAECESPSERSFDAAEEKRYVLERSTAPEPVEAQERVTEAVEAISVHPQSNESLWASADFLDNERARSSVEANTPLYDERAPSKDSDAPAVKTKKKKKGRKVTEEAERDLEVEIPKLDDVEVRTREEDERDNKLTKVKSEEVKLPSQSEKPTESAFTRPSLNVTSSFIYETPPEDSPDKSPLERAEDFQTSPLGVLSAKDATMGIVEAERGQEVPIEGEESRPGGDSTNAKMKKKRKFKEKPRSKTPVVMDVPETQPEDGGGDERDDDDDFVLPSFTAAPPGSGSMVIRTELMLRESLQSSDVPQLPRVEEEKLKEEKVVESLGVIPAEITFVETKTPVDGAAVAEGMKAEISKTRTVEATETPTVKIPDLAQTTKVSFTEVPVVKTTTVEAPIAEAPITETPMIKAQIEEEPVAEEPTAEITIAETLVAEIPISEVPLKESHRLTDTFAKTPDVEKRKEEILEKWKVEISTIESIKRTDPAELSAMDVSALQPEIQQAKTEEIKEKVEETRDEAKEERLEESRRDLPEQMKDSREQPKDLPESMEDLPESKDSPAQESQEAISKEPSKLVEFDLYVEEKRQNADQVSPKVSVTMKIKEDKGATVSAQILHKDIFVTLPKTEETGHVEDATSPIAFKPEIQHEIAPTPSDIDHGGRRSKKKKKHKSEEPTPTATPVQAPDEEKYSLDTSLAESTEITMPEDSRESPETPKPTEEIFDEPPMTQSEVGFSGKDTGYEADKTLDESQVDADNEQKKKRKKKRKQKCKVGEEESNVPKSAYETTPVGESLEFSEDEKAPLDSTQVFKDEMKAKGKKKKKGKKVEEKRPSVFEDKVKETESEEEEARVQEAEYGECASPHDSYRTLFTQSEPGTVKIVEEGVPSRPESESPRELGSKLVTTVPVLEAVLTQENIAQTSPDPSEVQPPVETEEKAAAELISAQTSPVFSVETAESEAQTSVEEEEKMEKPEVKESGSQVERDVAEMLTQTSTPERTEVEIETATSAVQTASPEPTETAEGEVQTVTPEVAEIPRSESAMQTHVLESQESFAQTVSPDQPEVQTAELAVQAIPSDISRPEERNVQTSPEPSAPPLEDEVTQTSLPFVAPEEKLLTSEVGRTPEVAEAVAQTKPVAIGEIDELTPSSTPSEFEVHIEASLVLTPDTSESSELPRGVAVAEEKEEEVRDERPKEELVRRREKAVEQTEKEEQQKEDVKRQEESLHEFQPFRSGDVVDNENLPETPDVTLSSVESAQSSDAPVDLETASDLSSSESGEVRVRVTVDGIPVDNGSVVTTFLDEERRGAASPDENKKKKKKKKRRRRGKTTKPQEEETPQRDPHRSGISEAGTCLDARPLYSEVARRGSRSSSPVPGEEGEVGREPVVISSKLITNITAEQIKKQLDESEEKNDAGRKKTDESKAREFIDNEKVEEEKEKQSGIVAKAVIRPVLVPEQEDISLASSSSTVQGVTPLGAASVSEEVTVLEMDSKVETKTEETIPMQVAKEVGEAVGVEVTAWSKEDEPEEVSLEVEVEKSKLDENVLAVGTTDVAEKEDTERFKDVPQEIQQPEILMNVEAKAKLSVAQEEAEMSEKQNLEMERTAARKSPEEMEKSSEAPQTSLGQTTSDNVVSLEKQTARDKAAEKGDLESQELAKEKIPAAFDERIQGDSPSVEVAAKQKAIGDNSESPEESSSEAATVVNISITIPRDTPDTSLSEEREAKENDKKERKDQSPLTSPTVRTEDVQPKEKPVKKSKTKAKHITIEEAMSPTEILDTPLTPDADASVSTFQAVTSIWNRPIATAEEDLTRFIRNERQFEPQTLQMARRPIELQDLGVRWTQTQAIERMKNLQNAKKTTHLSDVLYLATMQEVATDESVEEKNNNVRQSIAVVKEAVEKKDPAVLQETIITTVETITTWLETIEYRIYLNRQQAGEGPSKERVEEFNSLKEEINNIEENVSQLKDVVKGSEDVCNEEERRRIELYLISLEEQVKVIEEVTTQNEQLVVEDYKRWENFLKGVEMVNKLISETKQQLDDLLESDASPQTILNSLEEIEVLNKSHAIKTCYLKTTARCLLRDFSGKEIPKELYTFAGATEEIKHRIGIEREKVLQLLSLADEYVQTLNEFSQIIEIAEALVESEISVSNLENLEEEMQNHRKFFVNLSHCRAILESLEENLDSETRGLHSELHKNLYERATVILEKATGRFQQMSLAASRWTVLEQGMKEEMRWLQVAQQRVPDLSSVTSADYDQYINLYQSLSLDLAHHHAKLSHLKSVAQKLQEMVQCADLEVSYVEALDIILKLQDDVNGNLRRLLAFREHWGSYNVLSDKLEYWLKDAEQDLDRIKFAAGSKVPAPGYMRQFWVSSRSTKLQSCTTLFLLFCGYLRRVLDYFSCTSRHIPPRHFLRNNYKLIGTNFDLTRYVVNSDL